MSPALLEPPMAGKKLYSLKLPEEIGTALRIVAALRECGPSDLAAEILGPVLAQMENEELSKRAAARLTAGRPALPRKGGGR